MRYAGPRGASQHLLSDIFSQSDVNQWIDVRIERGNFGVESSNVASEAWMLAATRQTLPLSWYIINYASCLTPVHSDFQYKGGVWLMLHRSSQFQKVVSNSPLELSSWETSAECR